MKKQEQKVERENDALSIDQYVDEVAATLDKWSSENVMGRSFILLVSELDGIKSEDGGEGVNSTLATGGSASFLSDTIYVHMKNRNDFDRIIAKACGRLSIEKLGEIVLNKPIKNNEKK